MADSDAEDFHVARVSYSYIVRSFIRKRACLLFLPIAITVNQSWLMVDPGHWCLVMNKEAGILGVSGVCYIAHVWTFVTENLLLFKC